MMLKFSDPPSYRRTALTKRSKLDDFTNLIEGYIEDHKRCPSQAA